MSDVVIGDILPYTQSIAIAGQTVFGSAAWTANYPSDVVVYQTPSGSPANDQTQILSYPSQYSVAFIGPTQAVQVTLVNPANAGDIITITRQTPADRLNLYTNTNFTPTMLNQDFGILTLVDQQAQLVNQLIGPRYNYSAEITDVVDTILPILGENQIWAKNASGTAIIAVDLNEIISGGTVTQVNTGLGLTGGPITDAGTISFAAMNANTFWGNITGVSALPTMVSTSYFLQSANNLSDLTNIPQARINLGLQIGVNVQAYSAALTSIAGLTTAANEMLYTTASNTYAIISPAANSVLNTNGSNVPSWTQTLPNTVQTNITMLGTQSQALNMGSNLINNVSNPVSAQDAATKNYVDTAGGAFLPLAGGTMSGAINMNSHKITNLTNPSVSADAANKAYVDSTVGNYLPLAGGTMSGVIDMGSHKIINVTDPTLSQDAVNLEYLNTQLALYLPLSGGTMTGAINMGSHKITSVTDPTNPQDAATKNYVDSVAIGFTVKQACAAATTANLTATYNNGASGIGATLTNSGALAALVVDGYTVNTNDRILVKNQSTTYQNGIYVATNVGSGAVAWVLTRSTDFDQPSEIQPGDLVIINNGSTEAGTSWLQTATVSAVGTDPILFSQFTFSATSVLLKANNLSDVANATTSFNNISPLTTKGDLIGFSTQNIRVAVGGSDTQILQVDSSAAAGISWSTATYPKTTTANQLLYSSATNTVSGLSSTVGGVLVTDASSVPQYLANPSASGKVLQSVNGAISAWSTPTYPSASGTAGQLLRSDGTNNVYSTSTYPNTNAINTLLYASSANVMAALPTGNSGVLVTSSTGVPSILAGGTTGQIFQASTSGTPGWSTPTFPTGSGASGAILISDGTNYIASTSLWPNTVGTSGKVVISNGTSNVYSTPTFPNASATSRKIIVSDGTNWVASTELWAVPGTSGNVLTSDGTNWTSAAPSSSSPLTTKGDIYTFSTVNARLPVASGDGKVLQVSSGATTGLAYSTPTYPSSSGASGKVLISDGTNNVYSTPTFPNASATSRKIIVSDGTNWVASTETYAVPGTSGNVMVSDGTNWTSGTPPNMPAAWGRVTQSGGTYTLRGSFNVASITKNSSGNLTITFTNAFADTNYTAIVSGTDAVNAIVRVNSTATGSMVIQIITTNGASTNNDSGFSFVCYGV